MSSTSALAWVLGTSEQRTSSRASRAPSAMRSLTRCTCLLPLPPSMRTLTRRCRPNRATKAGILSAPPTGTIASDGRSAVRPSESRRADISKRYTKSAPPSTTRCRYAPRNRCWLMEYPSAAWIGSTVWRSADNLVPGSSKRTTTREPLPSNSLNAARKEKNPHGGRCSSRPRSCRQAP